MVKSFYRRLIATRSVETTSARRQRRMIRDARTGNMATQRSYNAQCGRVPELTAQPL
jgi:hypothetical protein